MIASLIFLFLFFPCEVKAQDITVLPTYTIEEGDTLYVIASRFGTTVKEIVDVNQLANPDNLPIGIQIKIPGLEGVSGNLKIHPVPLGSDLRSLARSYGTDTETLIKLNRLTSPAQVYAGKPLIIPEGLPQPLIPAITLGNNKVLFEEAIRQNQSTWMVSLINKKSNTWDVKPDETLFLPDPVTPLGIHGSNNLNNITIDPFPLTQGKATIIKITTNEPIDLTGSLNDQPLTFYSLSDQEYASLTGIYALQDPGLLNITIQSRDRNKPFYLQQPILLEEGAFIQESIVGVDSLTIDPATIEQEDEILKQYRSSSSTRFWAQPFSFPVDDPCWVSTFGNRRMYNGGLYNYYHTGLDFTVCADNLNIMAPAPGMVIFASDVPIRGNFTLIDHGWGVYSGYAHQSEVFVKPGDRVETGQVIGQIGNTGRSIGPHLHWEIWVNGTPVDPLDWMERSGELLK